MSNNRKDLQQGRDRIHVGLQFCCKEEHDDEGCDLLPRKRDSSHLSLPESGKINKKR